MKVQFSGTRHLGKRMVLRDGLLVSEFKVNLISVCKLIMDNDCTVWFTISSCIIQDQDCKVLLEIGSLKMVCLVQGKFRRFKLLLRVNHLVN